MAQILGLHGLGLHRMTAHWWQWVLAGIIVASFILGASFLLYTVFIRVRKHWTEGTERRRRSTAPPLVARYLDWLSAETAKLATASIRGKPKTFGVFLGELYCPPSEDQSRVLSLWDVTVLDPSQHGILEAVSSSQCASKHIVGRLDLESFLQCTPSSSDVEVIRALRQVTDRLFNTFKRPDDELSHFTGVLLAGWETRFSPAVCNSINNFLANTLGFDVFLEAAPPTFLGEARVIDADRLAGLIFRNGTILPNGEKRDWFAMREMRSAIKAAVSQSCLRDFVVAMWETLDDDVELVNAVAKRSFSWCNFYSAMTWIGPRIALTDAVAALTKTTVQTPLGAFEWLKEDSVMRAHAVWRGNTKICKSARGHDELYSSLELLVPDLPSKLALLDQDTATDDSDVGKRGDRVTWIDGPPIWTKVTNHAQANPLSCSPHGVDYSGLGCFPLGFDCSRANFDELVTSQRHLAGLGLLDSAASEELVKVGRELQSLYDSVLLESWSGSPGAIAAIEELAKLLRASTGTDDNDDPLRVFIGLDSGFRTSSDSHFWGIYEADKRSGAMNLYISKKAKDLPGTILHTFMASRNCLRSECFMAEIAMAEWMGSLTRKEELAPRLVQDIEMLSPAEILQFLQHMALSNCQDNTTLLTRIRTCCEYQLMDVPSLAQLKAFNTTAYLRGDILATDLVATRIKWYLEQNTYAPDLAAATTLFSEVDVAITAALKHRQSPELHQLATVLQIVLKEDEIDARADFLALAAFCAIRKAAFEEVYTEVTDRNPLFNDQPDQAAAFAELFATGSRCESYFDVTPSVLGKMLSDRFRAHYGTSQNQPPPWDDNTTILASAYAAAKIDEDPEVETVPEMPEYRRFTLLSVFAFPALVDILMLTTTGRGLYLSAYMEQIEQQMATFALMIALLLSGAVGTWIACGGSYYLLSMAFSAMNMFVLTRLIAGIAFTLLGGLIALIFIGIAKGFYAGLIFFLYLLILTSYLSLLAVLANYQFPGFTFQSGRAVIVMCIPVLLTSPIVTMWVHHHDSLVYLTVLYGFVFVLLLAARQIGSQWGTWYLKVPTVTDLEVMNWYIDTKANRDKAVFASLTDPAALQLARKSLLAEVLRERHRQVWANPTKDPFVLRLAKGYSATMFLFHWYCKYANTKLPLPYSTTWNIQCRVALDTLRRAQSGIRLHNGFIHWRRAGDEVGCGILYFLVALLDKWIELVSGGKLVGLSAATNKAFRMAVGFGLAYYLVGAVILDYRAQPLHQLANRTSPQPVHSVKLLRQAAINDAKAKRELYWGTLAKFLLVHIWGLSATTAFIWAFEGSGDAMSMFLAYVIAYTGLLWYQYSKVFCGPHALKPLATAAGVGLPVGLIMRHFRPQFTYNSVIALALATWTAAFLALRSADIGMPKFGDYSDNGKKNTAVLHSHGGSEPLPDLSQRELSELFEAASAFPSEFCYRLSPETHPGVEVMTALMSWDESNHSTLSLGAFPNAKDLLLSTAMLWQDGLITVDIIPIQRLVQSGRKIRVLTRAQGDKLHVLVGLDLDLVSDEWIIDIRRNCIIIAEAIIHAAGEFKLGLSHGHAVLAESLITPEDEEKIGSRPVPEGIKRQLEHSSSSELLEVVQRGSKDLLQHLCFGLDINREWDNLPKDVRHLLLKYTRGETCALSDSHSTWLISTFSQDKAFDVDTYLKRCNLSAILTIHINAYALALSAHPANRNHQPLLLEPSKDLRNTTVNSSAKRLTDKVKHPFGYLYHLFGTCIKFSIIALIADPELQRELDYIMTRKPAVLRWPVTFVLCGLWMYGKALQRLVLPLFLFAGRGNVKRLSKDMKGMKTVIQKRRVVIESLDGPSTAFIRPQPKGGFKLYQYSGRYDRKPVTQELENLTAVNTYNNKLALTRRQEYIYGALVNEFEYEYQTPESSNVRSGRLSKRFDPKLALGRHCVRGQLEGQLIQYNRRGFVSSGSFLKDGNLMHFKFGYRKDARFDDELLRAEYILPHISVNVSWCAPPTRHPERLDRWIPHSEVMEATFVQDADVYESKWTYDHKFHPIIRTTLNGRVVDTPALIQYDWLDVLRKPKGCNISDDNPLFSFNSVKTTIFSRMLRMNTHNAPISTSRARSHLWKSWKEANEIDGVTARWLDETALRSDHMLKPYWRARDRGNLGTAEKYLSKNGDAIMASVEIDSAISSWTPLAFKMSDFFNFGQGGDAVINTRTSSSQLHDSGTELHVLATDTGTWPNEGGGVSACRRDMVDNLQTIKWHMVVESANDFGLPKYQIEQNIQSLKVIPLWGLDFLTPTHGIFQNCLDSAVQQKSVNTTKDDIRRTFLPILTALVRGARAIQLDRSIVEDTTKALVDLNTYFEASHHWGAVWNSKVARNKWRELWLAEDMENAKPPSEWFDNEHPTLSQLDQALELWYRYLFIFSIPIPSEIPTVFQASHHSVSAAYGIVCKVKRQCTLQIWDHAISWRETNLYLSSALCYLPPFIRNSLLGLMRMTSVLILQHADIVLPCADFFNPGWEVEIGTCQGALQHRRVFRRKVDPVVNGICDMAKFQPIEKIQTERPTVTMLSHVWYAKDIKTALLAADVIVNEWGFTDYHLDIYGALDKAPNYSTECQEIIASKSLRKNVVLRGSADPVTVLADTWLFLNSSVSEGLPLALGEAALTGAPVVCTDVGASLRVLTDPSSLTRYSAIVAPNDVRGLARAQINLLALLGEWSAYAEDKGVRAPVLPFKPTPEDVRIITKRMYDKSPQRRRLGMKGREIVQKSFSGERYLREHEQMLWVGKARAAGRGAVRPVTAVASTALAVNTTTAGLEEKDAVVAVHHASMRPWAQTQHSSSSGEGSSYASSLNGPQAPPPVAKPGFLEKATWGAESFRATGRPLLGHGRRWSRSSGSGSWPGSHARGSSLAMSQTPTDLELGLGALRAEEALSNV